MFKSLKNYYLKSSKILILKPLLSNKPTYPPTKQTNKSTRTMKLLLLLTALTPLLSLSDAHCIHVSGNAKAYDTSINMQTFSVLYYDGELVCSIDRAVLYGPSVPVKYDCHDGHYAALTEHVEFVLYSHDNKDYKIPTNARVLKYPDGVPFSWEWDVKQGC